MTIAKRLLELSAKFAVASELCRRNMYAQLTLGLQKRIDISVGTEESMLKIQVRSKQGDEWPGVKGIYGKDIVLVFVDFENKKDIERPDFYILTIEDWKDLVKKELELTGKIKNGEVSIDEKYMPTWKDGYQGMGIKPKMIEEYKERWDKIENIVKDVNSIN